MRKNTQTLQMQRYLGITIIRSMIGWAGLGCEVRGRVMDAQMAELIMERLTDALPSRAYPQFYASDVYRFLYACYLREQQIPLPPWLVPENEYRG